MFDLFVKMDWTEFIPNLIATFVGIFMPFFIQVRVEKSQKHDEAIHRIENIKTELTDIANIMIKLNYNQIHIDPIKTPIWDGLVNTNELLLIANAPEKKKYRKGIQCKNEATHEVDWYTLIYKIYGMIDEYNKWWNLYTEKLFLHDKDVVLEPILKQIKELKMILCYNSFADPSERLKALKELGREEANYKEEESIGYLLTVLNDKFPS